MIDCAGECANKHNKIRDVVMIQRIARWINAANLKALNPKLLPPALCQISWPMLLAVVSEEGASKPTVVGHDWWVGHCCIAGGFRAAADG